MKKSRTLSNYERRVLQKSKEGDTVKELAKKVGLSESKVRRAVEWLKYKGMLKTSSKTTRKVKLGVNGEEYAEKGLPELRLLKERGGSIKKLQKKCGLSTEEFNHALGYLKEEGVISIEEGEIKVEKKSWIKKLEKKSRALKKLEGKQYSSLKKKLKELVDEFSTRKTILELDEKTTIKISLTKRGKKTKKEKSKKKFVDKITPKILESEGWRDAEIRPYDIRAPAPKMYAGKTHSYTQFIKKLKDTLARMGFKEMTGPIVEKALYNCDALFMPQDHNARGIHDLFFTQEPTHANNAPDLKNIKAVHEDGWRTGSKGWGGKFSERMARRLVLRSQGTALSARTMMKGPEVPGKYFAVAKCFRPDVIDFSHNIEFNQVEGIVLDESLNLKKLLGMLKMFAEEVAGAEEVRYVPGYFPFTEPSVELMAKVPGVGWMELGGSGIFRPEVTEPIGVKVPVIAWGLGMDRLFMIKEGIKDIRELYSQKLGWLRSKEVKA